MKSNRTIQIYIKTVQNQRARVVRVIFEDRLCGLISDLITLILLIDFHRCAP